MYQRGDSIDMCVTAKNITGRCPSQRPVCSIDSKHFRRGIQNNKMPLLKTRDEGRTDRGAESPEMDSCYERYIQSGGYGFEYVYYPTASTLFMENKYAKNRGDI